MKITNFIAFLHLILLTLMVYGMYLDTVFGTTLTFVLLLVFTLIDVLARITIHKKDRIHSFFHPFSDKLVILVLLLVFTLRGFFPFSLLALFVIRDIIVGYIRLRASRDYVVLKGDIYGKVITLSQFIVVFVLVLKTYRFYAGTHNILWVHFDQIALFFFTLLAALLAIVSIFYYVIAYTKGYRSRIEVGKKIEKEKIVILANRKSGGYKEKYRRKLLQKFARRRNAKVIYLPKKGDIFAGIKEKIKDADQVIIAGGDGSFEGALNQPVLQQKPLGFFPLGAGNAFYSYFYKGKKFEYLRSRFQFKEIPLDIMEIEWQAANQTKKTQTLFASIGIDAEVIKHSEGMKHHNFADYWNAGSTVAFGKSIDFDISLQIDDKKHEYGNCSNLIISKIPYIGYGLRSLLEEVKTNNNMIYGLATVNTHSSFWNKALRLWTMLLSQLGIEAAPLISLHGKKWIIESQTPFALQAGGEFLGYTNWVKVSIIRKQNVLMI